MEHTEIQTRLETARGDAHYCDHRPDRGYALFWSDRGANRRELRLTRCAEEDVEARRLDMGDLVDEAINLLTDNPVVWISSVITTDELIGKPVVSTQCEEPSGSFVVAGPPVSGS